MPQFDAIRHFESKPTYLEAIATGKWKPGPERWYCGHCFDGIPPQDSSGWYTEQSARNHVLSVHGDLMRGEPEEGYDTIQGKDLLATLRRHQAREQQWLDRALVYLGSIHTIDDFLVDLG